MTLIASAWPLSRDVGPRHVSSKGASPHRSMSPLVLQPMGSQLPSGSGYRSLGTDFSLTRLPATSFRLYPRPGQAPNEDCRLSLLASRLQCFSVPPEASSPNPYPSQPSSKTCGSAHGLEVTMNTSAVTTAGHWNLSILTVRCSQDWKIPRCPLVLMFDLIRSAAKLFLIGIAGAVLGVAGFLLSILAYIKQAVDSRRPQRRGTDAPFMSESISPPRGRDLHARNPRIPQTRHDRSTRPSESPLSLTSPRTRPTRFGLRSPVTSSNSSQGPETSSPELPEEQPPGPSSRRRSQGSPCGKSASDANFVANPIISVPREVTSGVTAAVPPWAPRRSLSDASELSTRRLSLDGHLSVSGRRVLMKIKDSHSNLRERCLSRVQSLPPRKSSARPPRTDPYQAPYFFPSPMSPEAATYIQEVVNERQGAHLPSVMNSVVAAVVSEPNPSSTRVHQKSETVSRPARPSSHPPSPTPSSPIAKLETSPSTKRHRWSLHLPHLPPHHHVSDGSRPVAARMQEKGTTVHKELFSKLTLGHHRRRHRIGSVDSHATVSSAES